MKQIKITTYLHNTAIDKVTSVVEIPDEIKMSDIVDNTAKIMNDTNAHVVCINNCVFVKSSILMINIEEMP